MHHYITIPTHYIILILACHPSPLFPPIVALYKSPLLAFCTTDEDPRIETSCFNELFAVICSSNYLLMFCVVLCVLCCMFCVVCVCCVLCCMCCVALVVCLNLVCLNLVRCVVLCVLYVVCVLCVLCCVLCCTCCVFEVCCVAFVVYCLF